MTRSPAQRRYNYRVIALSAIYAALLFPVVFLFRRQPPSGAVAYVLAVLPALPIIGIFAAIGRYLIEERDEYLRLLMIRQTLVASGLALSAAMAVGFLESFDLIAPIHSYWFAILWFAGLGLGGCVNRLTVERDG